MPEDCVIVVGNEEDGVGSECPRPDDPFEVGPTRGLVPIAKRRREPKVVEEHVSLSANEVPAFEEAIGDSRLRESIGPAHASPDLHCASCAS